jgi:hypothetical protein
VLSRKRATGPLMLCPFSSACGATASRRSRPAAALRR